MKRINQTFEKLHASKSIDEVDKILDDLDIEDKYRMKEEFYPPIEFKITKQEIEGLKEKRVITADNLLTDISEADTLTKLLYSISWKNGDLKKIRHIIEGIISDQQNEKDEAFVFYQFGKYLTKTPGEPIIDQHVLRAFGIFIANGDKDKIEKLKRLSVISKKEKELIGKYKSWLTTGLTKELRENDNYSYHVDKVLFAVGKSVKEKSGISSPSNKS